jgi:hypothetical protein
MSEKLSKKYECENKSCNYTTDRLDNYKRHLVSKLHKKRLEKSEPQSEPNSEDELIEEATMLPEPKVFVEVKYEMNEEENVPTAELATELPEPQRDLTETKEFKIKCCLCDKIYETTKKAEKHRESKTHQKKKQNLILTVSKLNLNDEELKKYIDNKGFVLI